MSRRSSESSQDTISTGSRESQSMQMREQYLVLALDPNSRYITDEMFKELMRTHLPEYFDRVASDPMLSDFGNATIRYHWVKKLNTHYINNGDGISIQNIRKTHHRLLTIVSQRFLDENKDDLVYDEAPPKFEARSRIQLTR